MGLFNSFRPCLLEFLYFYIIRFCRLIEVMDVDGFICYNCKYFISSMEFTASNFIRLN